MSDIVLVYPHVGNMDVIRDNPHLPLPVIQTAVLINQEYKVSILDLRVDSDWQTWIDRELESNPLFVGFSVMSGLPVASSLAIARYQRKE